MAKSSYFWVKIRYEKEIRVHVPNEDVAKAKAMHDFIEDVKNIKENDLRIIHVVTSEDR